MTTTTPVEEYLAEVRAALADLPPAEVDAICQDLGPQLADVAAELGERVSTAALAERLGTPAAYAAELRAAAGYVPAAGPKSRIVGFLLVLCAAWGAAAGLLSGFNSIRDGFYLQAGNASEVVLLLFVPMAFAAAPIARGIVPVIRLGSVPLPAGSRDYLESLRPAWRLFRAVILIGGAIFALRYPAATGESVMLPLIMLGLLLWFGRDRRWAGVTVPANAFAAGMGAAMALTLWSYTSL